MNWYSLRITKQSFHTLFVYNKVCCHNNLLDIWYTYFPLIFQLSFHQHWQWTHQWSQRQTQSHYTVSHQHLPQFITVIFILGSNKVTKATRVYRHWQELNCCLCHIRGHLLRSKSDAFTQWNMELWILLHRTVTHPPSPYKVRDSSSCF